MDFRFARHYTREEARRLLPEVRIWLRRLRELRVWLEHQERDLGRLLRVGRDVGGDPVHAWVRTLMEAQGVQREFTSRELQVADLERGRVHFPTILGGREAFLCWEQDEADVEFWRELDAGGAGRTPLGDP